MKTASRTHRPALIFDCDGVLADTERDGHRVAFNRTFIQNGLEIEWSVEQYRELLNVSGGKERLRTYFEHRGWPPSVRDRDAFVGALHGLKTTFFLEIIDSGEVPLRSGVARIVDAAIEAGLPLGVCSTSDERAVTRLVEVLLGPERLRRFAFILAGDVVPAKKPDPAIYERAKAHLGLPGRACVVVEDSRNGLLAATGAGLRCVITRSAYTGAEDFSEADLVVDELGDPPGPCVTLDRLIGLTRPDPS